MTKEAAPQEKNAAVFQKSEGLLPEEWRVPVQLAAKGRNSTNNGFLPDPDSDFLESVLIPKEAMLARISGDSMSPVILSGQYAIIGPQFLDSALPVDRMIVVVEVFDNPDTTVTIDSDWVGFYCKRIQQRDNICYFTSINPDGDSFSVARENCRLWPVIGTLYAGHGVPPED